MLTASKAAQSVFSKYARTIPVNPAEIAKEMGIIVKMSGVLAGDEFSGVCGAAYISEEDGNKYIIFNGDDAKTRQRFTIAHELGHHVLGHTKYQPKLRDTNYTIRDPIETAANNFAAELLVPMRMLEIAIGDDLKKSTKELANMFDVSESVMSIRLEQFYKNYLSR